MIVIRIIVCAAAAYIVLSAVPGIVLAFVEKDERWWRFARDMLVCAAADCVGFVLLLVAAACHAWEPGVSTEWAPDAKVKEHAIVVWSWPINGVWGDPEDGLLPPWYYPSWPDWLRAYLWAGWRNRSDALKYAFAWPGGPFWKKNFGSHYAMAGYRNAAGLLVCSAGAGHV